MNYNTPLISCICITNHRALVFQRALSCFLKQDYPNTELVISYPEHDRLTKTIIDQLAGISLLKMIRIEHYIGEEHMLTRNNAINAANGAFICIWNDEHWHHVNRVSDQYRVFKEGPFMSSILMHVLLFDFKSQQTYQSNYRNWEETLLCEKQLLLQASYIDIERTDDSSVIHFLSSENLLYHLPERSHLYIYIYGQNKRSNFINYSNYFFESQLLEDINPMVQDLINTDHYSL